MSNNIFTGGMYDDDVAKNREWLVDNLFEGVVEVTFTKKDGTERVMNCTLCDNFLPETGLVGHGASKDAVKVFDTDKQAWRSFRWESVKAVKISVESANA